MKNSTKHATKFKAVIKKLKASEPILPEQRDPVTLLAFAFCSWESTAERAVEACQKLRKNLVDWNDLRVCKVDEIVEMAGFNDAHKEERAKRLRSSLHAIFLREHETSLDALHDMKKRETREYIESLDGMVPYVSSFVLMHAFEVNGVPVDEQMRTLLIEKDAIDPDADINEVSGWVSRQVSADDSIKVSCQMRAWADAESTRLAKEALAANRQNAQQRKRQVTKMETARKKAIEQAAAEAKKKAEKLAAKQAAAEAKAKAAAKKAAAKKKVTKKKVTKKKVTKKAATKKKVTKKAATRKKAAAKKKVTKKKVTKKAATKKKVAKKAATRKKPVAKKKTSKKAAKKKVTKKKVTKKKTTRKKRGR